MRSNRRAIKNLASLPETIAVSVVCILATFLMFYIKYPARLPYADEFEYLGYAFGVYKFGVFAQVKDPTLPLKPDMFFPPLYPYFLALLMKLDQTFADTISCMLTNLNTTTGGYNTSGCAPKYGWAIGVQLFFAGLAIFFVWGTARRLSGSAKVAVFAAVLAFIAKSYIYYANHFLTEAVTLPLAAGFGWVMVVAWQDRTAKSAAFSAVIFGLLVLTRAGWGYAALVVFPIFILMGCLGLRDKGMRAFTPFLVFGIVYAAVLAPWVVRNTVTFETPALTAGYGDKALMHRLPYNRMTNDELKAAFVYWLPDFGDKLAAKLFPKEQYERLDFSSPNGFYRGERAVFMAEVNANKGTRNTYSYFIEHEIMGNLKQHVVVTMAMVWRGMFVAKIWGLVAWVFFLPLFFWALYKRWGGLIVLALPPLFMLGLNAFVSVSIPRYNLFLIPVLSFSVAYVLSNARMFWLSKR